MYIAIGYNCIQDISTRIVNSVSDKIFYNINNIIEMCIKVNFLKIKM